MFGRQPRSLGIACNAEFLKDKRCRGEIVESTKLILQCFQRRNKGFIAPPLPLAGEEICKEFGSIAQLFRRLARRAAR